MRRTIISVLLIATLAAATWLVRVWHRPYMPRKPTEPEIIALAQDAHVVVGDVPLVLPFIAISDQVSMGAFFSLDPRKARDKWRRRRDAFRTAASDPATAPVLDVLKIWVGVYQSTTESYPSIWAVLCPHLAREWSRSVCADAWTPLYQSFPRETVSLADNRRLDVFQRMTTVSGESWGDQLRAVRLVEGTTSIVCDKTVADADARFCTAAILVRRHLVAVWSVTWRPGQEPVEAQARREGELLSAFVRYGIAGTEDFPALQAVACATRRPGATAFPGREATYPCTPG